MNISIIHMECVIPCETSGLTHVKRTFPHRRRHHQHLELHQWKISFFINESDEASWNRRNRRWWSKKTVWKRFSDEPFWSKRNSFTFLYDSRVHSMLPLPRMVSGFCVNAMKITSSRCSSNENKYHFSWLSSSLNPWICSVIISPNSQKSAIQKQHANRGTSILMTSEGLVVLSAVFKYVWNK